MKPEEFIKQIIGAYHEARVPVIHDNRLSRGRSRSISAIAEDLFAGFLISNDKSIEKILIDQTINVNSAKHIFNPDIAVIKNGQITAFMDLKMDMGWKRRELLNLCKHHGQTVLKAKGRSCSFKDGQTKEISNIQISGDVTYSIVIISRRNSGNNLDDLRAAAKGLSPIVDTFLLCDSPRNHPNIYGVDPNELIEKLEINTSEFDRLLKKLK